LLASRVEWLEAETDKLSADIPPLNQFVLPGETMASAWLDVVRTIIRRAERGVVKLSHEEQLENNEIMRYLNRLSSLLFALARYEEVLAGHHPTLAKDVS
jgi:cob(I)alamin adenosyltransferase